MPITIEGDEQYVMGHTYQGVYPGGCDYITGILDVNQQGSENYQRCGYGRSKHADPGVPGHLIDMYPHDFQPMGMGAGGFPAGDHCARELVVGEEWRVCGYPRNEHEVRRQPVSVGEVVRLADVAQYAREPMPDRARQGIVVTLIDEPTDPLGTLAVMTGMYEGRVARSKSDVTDEQRRAAWEDMNATVLSGALEGVHFTFLVEGVSRAITHQMVRNRFSFFAQESLRFAVVEDWAQEVPLPPVLAGLKADDPKVMVWRRALNQAEDSYAALVSAGMPAEEARGLLPHAITTRLYWSVSLRTLLMEAGKRTCTQAQFDWRTLFGGIAKALRERGRADESYRMPGTVGVHTRDGWQYRLFAEALRPACYQEGKCGFMAEFDRGCTIRSRVDANERLGRPSSEWHTEYDVVPPGEVVVGVGPKSVVVDSEDRPLFVGAIDPREWAADPSAARVKE